MRGNFACRSNWHGEPLRAFWQARFYGFNVYSKGKKMEKLLYRHANPVIQGLAVEQRVVL